MAESDAAAAAPVETSPEQAPSAGVADASREQAPREAAMEPPAGGGEDDHKRKLEEAVADAEAVGNDDAKRQRVGGETDGSGVEQSIELAEKAEAAAVETNELPEKAEAAALENDAPAEKVEAEAMGNGEPVDKVEAEAMGNGEPVDKVEAGAAAEATGNGEPVDKVEAGAAENHVPAEKAHTAAAGNDKVESAPAENGQVAPTEPQPSSVENLLHSVTEASQQEIGVTGGVQETVSCKIEVPNSKVGVLIGKAGDTIKFLQMNSGAKIQIMKDAEADPNAPTRPVEIVGSLESIDRAEQLIRSVIAEADAGGSPALIARGFGSGQAGSEQFEMIVPDDKVGLIIGKGGETIKSLQTRSGARIQLIPQHPPEGVKMTERTVRLSGNKKQIEAAKEMIKQAMNQTLPRQTAQSGGYVQQTYRPSGPVAAAKWGPRMPHQAQPSYGYQQRGMPPSQNMSYPQPYGNYPQQPPQRGGMGMGWDQRQGAPPPSSLQGGGYDYYRQGSQPYDNQAPNFPPGSGAPMGNYSNYGPSQASGYGQPTQYPPAGPPQMNYGHGYGDPKYHAQVPNQQYYGQLPMSSQPGYSQQPDPHARPAYGGSGQWAPRGTQPVGDGTYQAPPPTSFVPPAQQGPYGQSYGQGPAGPDGYAQPVYTQPGTQMPAPYVQGAPSGPGYAQQATQQGGYAQYPPSQPGYGDQAAPNNMNHGYQGGSADPNYATSYPQSGYGAAPPTQAGYVQAGYAQQPTNPTGYDQSAPPPQTGYVAPPGNPQPNYAKGVSPQPGYGGQWAA